MNECTIRQAKKLCSSIRVKFGMNIDNGTEGQRMAMQLGREPTSSTGLARILTTSLSTCIMPINQT